MKEKLLGAARSALPWIRGVGFGMIGLVVLAIGALVAAMVARPPSHYAAPIEAAIRDSTGAKTVKWSTLKWAVRPLSLGLGVEARDVEISGARAFDSLRAQKLSLVLQPLKILTGRIPAHLEAVAPILALSAAEAIPARNEDPLPPSEGDSGAVPQELPFAKWLPALRLTGSIKDGVVEAGAAAARWRLEGLEIDSRISGLPGTFALRARLNVVSPPQLATTSASGSLDVDLEGFFQLDNGVPVGVKVDRLEVNADHLIVAHAGIVEKPDTLDLSLKTPLFVRLDGGKKVRSAEINDAKLRLGRLNLGLRASHDFSTRESTLAWELARSEVKDLRLPLRILRQIPFAGAVESGGDLRVVDGKVLDGAWRFVLHQMRVEAAELSELIDPSSVGPIHFSFVSEGRMQDGIPSTPRTELQFQGAEARIEIGKGLFAKPKGDRFEGLVRLTAEEDEIRLKNLTLQLHTAEFVSSGSLRGLQALRDGKEATWKLDARTNRVDLSRWSGYSNISSRPPPIEGFLEFGASFDGKTSGASLDAVSWRVDRLNLSQLKGAFDAESYMKLGLAPENYGITGPFSASLLFQGRGRGSVVDQATLSAKVDLSDVGIRYQRLYRKPEGTPFVVEFLAEQARNRLKIRRGHLTLHKLDLDINGELLQGSRRNSIRLDMTKPLKLSEWRSFFVKPPEMPIDGSVQWKGAVTFGGDSTFEGDLDLAKVSLDGTLEASGLKGSLPGLPESLLAGSGRAQIKGASMTLPTATLKFPSTTLQVSGNLRPRAVKGVPRESLAAILKARGWEGALSLALTKLPGEWFDPKRDADGKAGSGVGSPSGGASAKTEFGDQLRTALERQDVKESQFELALRIDEGRYGEISFRDLASRTLWKNGALRLAPFSVGAFGGKLSGSGEIDASGFYLRGDAPQFALNVKTDKVDIEKLLKVFKPELASAVGGLVSGDLAVGSRGFENEKIAAALKGRLNGRIEAGRFDPIWALDRALEGAGINALAKDFLAKELRRERCVQRDFRGQIDVEIAGGAFQIAEGKLSFGTGSEVVLNGRLERDLATSLQGRLLPSEACVGGDARACLASGDGRAEIPFSVGGTATAPSASIDFDAIGRKLASCVGERIRRRAESAARQVIESDEAKKIRGQLEDKLKDILKRGR